MTGRKPLGPTDPCLGNLMVHVDFDGTGGETLRAGEAIRRILDTDLRRDPSDGIAYRRIAAILWSLGRRDEAKICVAGSMLKAIDPAWVDLSSVPSLTAEEASADPTSGVRKLDIVTRQPETPYRASKTWDGTCPPALAARERKPSRPLFVVEVTGGRAVTGNIAYGIFTHDGRYLTDFCGNDGRLIGAADPAARAPLRHLPGTTIFLAHAYANSNFHWMLETLPRFLPLRVAGFDPARADHILTRPLFPYQIEALALLGVAPEKLVFVHDHTHVSTDRLIVTSNIESYDYSVEPPSIEVEPWISHFIAGGFGFSAPSPEQAVRRVHISRKRAQWRNIVNQDDVTAFLEENGFTTVYFEDMTLEEKYRVLNGAEVVTGLFGAGFTHLPFCRPGTKVVLFYPGGALTDTYWTLCNHAGLEHHHLLCEDINNYFPLSQRGRVSGTIDTIVNLDHLKRTLRGAGLTDLRDIT